MWSLKCFNKKFWLVSMKSENGDTIKNKNTTKIWNVQVDEKFYQRQYKSEILINRLFLKFHIPFHRQGKSSIRTTLSAKIQILKKRKHAKNLMSED